MITEGDEETKHDSKAAISAGAQSSNLFPCVCTFPRARLFILQTRFDFGNPVEH